MNDKPESKSMSNRERQAAWRARNKQKHADYQRGYRHKLLMEAYKKGYQEAIDGKPCVPESVLPQTEHTNGSRKQA